MRRRSVVAISVLTTLATEFCLKHWASFRWTPVMTHWLKVSGAVVAVLIVVGCGLLWKILSSFNRFPPMVSDPKARQEWIAKNCREK